MSENMITVIIVKVVSKSEIHVYRSVGMLSTFKMLTRLMIILARMIQFIAEHFTKEI